MSVGSLVEGVAPTPEHPELIVWHGVGALLKRIFLNLPNNSLFFRMLFYFVSYVIPKQKFA